jgi:hypothetical protein
LCHILTDGTAAFPGYSGASGAVNPNTIDDATLKQTAKAYVKVRQIVQKAELDLNNTTDHAQQEMAG